jgi:PE-PPE domain-containing protein
MASGEAGLLTLTVMTSSALAFGAPSPPLPPPIPVITEVMGGSGNPIPGITGPDIYLPGMENDFILPNLPGTDPVVLATPEQLYPLTGVNALPLDQSVNEGVTILNNAIQPDLTAGTPVGVFGYSQSAVIATLEMEKLANAGTPSDVARFVLAANPLNPDGGLLERFGPSDLPGLVRPELTLPSLGLDAYGVAPGIGDYFPATVYTGEYDGFADFPRYPIDFLSDLNAVFGIIYVHPHYDEYTVGPDGGQATPVADGGQAIALPTDGPTETTYYMIPTETLPLLAPLQSIPVIGQPLYDLLEPDMRILVNLGYGSITDGWDPGPANVPTPFGFLPTDLNPSDVLTALENGTQQGIQAFIACLSNPSCPLTEPSGIGLTDPFATVTVGAPPTSFTDVVNDLSSALSTAYATLLPTADSINALLTSIPAYDLSLFLDNLSSPLDAIGLPIAADTGLATVIGGLDSLVFLGAAGQIAGDFGLSL